MGLLGDFSTFSNLPVICFYQLHLHGYALPEELVALFEEINVEVIVLMVPMFGHEVAITLAVGFEGCI